MKLSTLLLVLATSVLVGCQSTPAPTPGKATLRISAVAEPKTGVVTGNTHVLTYDTSGAQSTGTGQFERVDYTSLNDIVIWVEQDTSGSAESKPTPSTPTPTAPTPKTQGAKSSAGEVVTWSPIEVAVNANTPEVTVAAAVHQGHPLRFHNSGSVSLNLYSVSDGNDFDLGVIGPGSDAIYNTQSPGLIEILSDKLKDPVALVYVTPSDSIQPTLTHAGQTVDFTNLWPGKYIITSWHPRLPGQQISVTLSPNQITSATIKVGVNNLPKPSDR